MSYKIYNSEGFGIEREPSLDALYQALELYKKAVDISAIPYDTKLIETYFHFRRPVHNYRVTGTFGPDLNLEIPAFDIDHVVPIGRTGGYTKPVKELPASTDLSNYTITSDGLIADTWDSIINVEARVVEIRSETVVLECIVDADKFEFQNRSFEKNFFNGIPILEKYPILIKIFKRKNEVRHLVLSGQGLFDDSKFEIDHFNGLDLSFLNKKF